MSADILTAAFSGLAVVLTAISGVAASRARSAGISRRQYRRLERRFLVALAHIFALEATFTAHTGHIAPPRPDGLDDDDNDTPPLPTAAPRA